MWSLGGFCWLPWAGVEPPLLPKWYIENEKSIIYTLPLFSSRYVPSSRFKLTSSLKKSMFKMHSSGELLQNICKNN